MGFHEAKIVGKFSVARSLRLRSKIRKYHPVACLSVNKSVYISWISLSSKKEKYAFIHTQETQIRAFLLRHASLPGVFSGCPPRGSDKCIYTGWSAAVFFIAHPAVELDTASSTHRRTRKMAEKTPVKKTVKKPKTPAAHPKYSEMVATAVGSLKERGGSSRQAILKYIMANFKVGSDAKAINGHLKIALRNGVKKGALKQSKGTGAAGSFKLGEKPKPAKKPAAKKVTKPKAAKPKKPAKKATTTDKKPKAKTPKKAAKKTAEKKKPAAKKAAKPKTPKKAKATKSPKKAKAAKPKKVKTPKK